MNQKTILTPVVFMIFNRPAETGRVFKAIADAKPKKLFIIADGPRSSYPNDVENCAKTRAIVENIDWDCEVKRNYSRDNLGLGKRVWTGLDWVFSQVDEAIILEDDCLPAPAFFHYCQSLLEYYRDDKRVMHVGGNNFQFGNNKTKYSYFFSKYNHIWGWATWKRTWKHYDFYMKSWPEVKKSGMMKRACEDRYERDYWMRIFDGIYLEDPKHTWDYQWVYACWLENGLAAYPSVNLISNIGFGENATHTKGNDNPLSCVPAEEIFEIKHPLAVERNKPADEYTFDHVFGGLYIRKENSSSVKIYRYASLLKKKLVNF